MNGLDALDEYTLTPGDMAEVKAPINPRYPGAFSSDEPSPYQQSSEYRSKVEQDFPNAPDGLYNPRDPHYPIQHERTVHMIMCYMAARGDTNLEIAEATGRTAVCVSNVLRQPWAKSRIEEIVKKSGKSEVELVMRGAAAKALNRLLTEMDNMETKQGANSQSRITASDKILDRLFGKAAQPIIKASIDLNSLPDEELAKMLPTTERTA